jgi:(S)-ureidoglycine aminohydrolase
MFGSTRTRICHRHALIAPDSHVRSNLPGFEGADCVVLISEAMGAAFAQLQITFQRGGSAAVPGSEIETAGYCRTGGGVLRLKGKPHRCRPGSFFFVPAGEDWNFAGANRATELTLFQKRYEPLSGSASPDAIVGHASEVKGQPFLGDPDARLQVLFPDRPPFDLAMNIFTYQPGATLPFVETHVMEHGLLMLEGQGVYRLEESWYPVTAGDAIWMAPYCPQWFVAMGKKPASYLYYKDINRPAL